MGRKKSATPVRVDMDEWVSLANLLKEGAAEQEMRAVDPLESYIIHVQDELRKKMKGFPERFARGGSIILETLQAESEE